MKQRYIFISACAITNLQKWRNFVGVNDSPQHLHERRAPVIVFARGCSIFSAIQIMSWFSRGDVPHNVLRLQSRILTDLLLETLFSEYVGRNSMTSQTPLVTQSASKCLIIGLCSLVSSAAQYSTGAARTYLFQRHCSLPCELLSLY